MCTQLCDAQDAVCGADCDVIHFVVAQSHSIDVSRWSALSISSGSSLVLNKFEEFVDVVFHLLLGVSIALLVLYF